MLSISSLYIVASFPSPPYMCPRSVQYVCLFVVCCELSLDRPYTYLCLFLSLFAHKECMIPICIQESTVSHLTLCITFMHMYCLYVLFMYTAYMYCLYVLLICTAYTYVLLICTVYVYCLYVLLICTAYTYVLLICTAYMYCFIMYCLYVLLICTA